MTATRVIRSGLLAAAVCLSAALAPLAARAAATPYYIDFSSNSDVDVSDVAIFSRSTHSCCGYDFSESAVDVTIGDSVLTDGMARSDTPFGDFLMGLTNEDAAVASASEAVASDPFVLASSTATSASNAKRAQSADVSAERGVVLFVRTDFAERFAGDAFSAAFADVSESDLVSWLEDPAAHTQKLKDFANTYASELDFEPGQSYSEIEFSNGAIVGTGVSYETPRAPGVSATPEPSVWALMIAGVGLAGASLSLGRRRKLRAAHALG